MIDKLLLCAQLAVFALVVFWFGIGAALLEKYSEFTINEAVDVGMKFCGCDYSNIEWINKAPMNAYVIECTNHTRITVGKDTTLTRRGDDKCQQK